MAERMQLTAETIDLLSEKVAKMYSSCGAGKKDTTRARLLLEETLIKYRNHFSETLEISFREYHILGQYRFSMRIKAPSFDPFSLEENPMAFMIESVMSSLENGLPTWKYHNLENEIVFTVRKKAKLSEISKIALAVFLSLAAAIPLRLFCGGEQLSGFVKNYLDPISDAYAGLFCIMAVLMTFFAITLSIVQIGDMSAVSSTGGRIMRRFFLMSTLAVLLLCAPVLPFLHYGEAGSLSLAVNSVFDLLIGFIPSNIVSPFLNFNTMHLMIVGAMFGFALLTLGQKGGTLTKVFDECNLVSVTTNTFLNKFISIYVAFKVFSLITASDFDKLMDAGVMVAVIVAGEVLLFIFYTVYVCLRNHISFREYFHHMLPSFAVCLSSANFGAAFPSLVDGLIGLDSFDESSSIAINLGSVVFRPACTLVFFFSSVFMASFYGVEISVIWVVTALILSFLLVAAVPNIPGVSVSVITLLFAQLGLPAEAVAMMITVNAPLQFLTVTVDTWCLAAECVTINRKQKAEKA